MIDPYVYPGTDILKNVLGIKNRQGLDDAEADYVSLRLRELAEKLTCAVSFRIFPYDSSSRAPISYFSRRSAVSLSFSSST